MHHAPGLARLRASALVGGQPIQLRPIWPTNWSPHQTSRHCTTGSQAPAVDNTSDAACCRRLDVLEELFSRPCIRRAALTPDHNGRTFLFYMAEWGDLTYAGYQAFDAVIQAAQELGVDVNHQAHRVSAGQGQGLNCLLTSQSTNQPANCHLSLSAPLLPAAECHNGLLTASRLALQDHNGDTVLHVAIRATARRRRDDSAFFQRWIEAGARPRQVDGLRQLDSLSCFGHCALWHGSMIVLIATAAASTT